MYEKSFDKVARNGKKEQLFLKHRLYYCSHLVAVHFYILVNMVKRFAVTACKPL